MYRWSGRGWVPADTRPAAELRSQNTTVAERQRAAQRHLRTGTGSDHWCGAYNVTTYRLTDSEVVAWLLVTRRYTKSHRRHYNQSFFFLSLSPALSLIFWTCVRLRPAILLCNNYFCSTPITQPLACTSALICDFIGPSSCQCFYEVDQLQPLPTSLSSGNVHYFSHSSRTVSIPFALSRLLLYIVVASLAVTTPCFRKKHPLILLAISWGLVVWF